MAGLAGNSWKWLEMAGNCRKCIGKKPGNGFNVWKWLEMAGVVSWKRLEMAGNGTKLLEIAENV